MLMKTVGFSEFRRNASALLDEVEQGEPIQIARHGKVVARLVAAHASHDPGPGRRRQATPLVIPGFSLTQAILDERESG